MMELNTAMAEKKRYEKSEEPKEIDETNTDSNMQREQKESKKKKKLVITRHQEYDMNKVRYAVKRPGASFEAHENPHSLTTFPPEESLQASENAQPSPTTKLRQSSVRDQDDLTETMAPQHMEKVHKDDSSESEYMVETVPSYKLKMGVRMIKKRKYEDLGETGESDEMHTDRDAIMGNTTHEDSAPDDNAKHEPQDHNTSLSDVPQATTQTQASPHKDEEKDAKMTSHLTNISLEAEQFSQLTTQTPEEKWPTEAPEVFNTKKNRSLEGQHEKNYTTSGDRDKGVNLPKEKMDVGRNDEEDHVPNENITGDDDNAKTYDEERTPEPISSSTQSSILVYIKWF
jgi:hypothetical protein